MPWTCTRNWWLFPPQTQELQLDEKWSFVHKKRRRCSEEELEQECSGDCWDHVAFDPEHRLVLAVVFGRREQRNIQKLLLEVKKKLEDRVPRLICTDGLGAYEEVFQRVFGQWIKPCRKPGDPHRVPRREVSAELTYAMVQKETREGRVVKVDRKLVLGSEANLQKALGASKVSRTINTSFVERHNGTDRGRNARKARRTYRFSKDWAVHVLAGYFILYSYNFCWCVRTLRQRRKDGTYEPRTPAMAAGLTDHVWTLEEWLSYPAVSDSG
jgi:IS1 family transposase